MKTAKFHVDYFVLASKNRVDFEKIEAVFFVSFPTFPYILQGRVNNSKLTHRLKFRTNIANRPRKTHGKFQFLYSSIFTKKAVIKNTHINPYKSHINGAWATCA
jgi:dihydroxyacid dehydratase/phosphogluconate dehydratase